MPTFKESYGQYIVEGLFVVALTGAIYIYVLDTQPVTAFLVNGGLAGVVAFIGRLSSDFFFSNK